MTALQHCSLLFSLYGQGAFLGVSRPFALLQRRMGCQRAAHPSPPQSTHVPASKLALKALQRMITMLNGQDVRLGSPLSGRDILPPVPTGLWRQPGRGFRAPAFILLQAALFGPLLLARPLLYPLAALRGTSGSASVTPPVGRTHYGKHTCNFPVLAAPASVMASAVEKRRVGDPPFPSTLASKHATH
jgi:hypothetical protein